MATKIQRSIPKPSTNGHHPVTPAPQPATPPNQPTALWSKFQATRQELGAALIERADEIDLALTAMIAGEHLLLVGPPGTAKSLLLDSLATWLSGSRFSLLLTKFTTPEEVCGPISVVGLKADQYRRVTTGMLPEAELAFLDEIFKASSAILNTMLRILNERLFYNGGAAHACPLRLCVAASNEWPGDDGGKELGALFDRFLFRKRVRPVAGYAGLERLLWNANLTPSLSTTITPADLDQATKTASSLPWTPEAQDALRRIIAELRKEGIQPGDRRLRKAVKAAQAFTWLNGYLAVEPEHLEVLAHVLWEDPGEQADKAGKIIGKIANPTTGIVQELVLEAEKLAAEANPHDVVACGRIVEQVRERYAKLKALKDTTGKVQQAMDYVHSLGHQVLASIASSGAADRM